MTNNVFGSAVIYGMLESYTHHEDTSGVSSMELRELEHPPQTELHHSLASQPYFSARIAQFSLRTVLAEK